MPDQTRWQGLDVLSPPARAAAAADAATAYTRLVVRGGGSEEGRRMLEGLRPEGLLKVPVRPEDAQPILAGLWLWHDWLAESHEISQKLRSESGSYWHAVMHRREGDFSNAKYWYARCRHHPVLDQIPALARTTLGVAALAGPLHDLVKTQWNPDGFVDVVEAIHAKPDDPLHAAAVRLQQIEWQALFTHCARKAAGAGGG